MREFRNLKAGVRVYVGLVVAVGAATFAYSAHRLYVEPLDQQWLILAGLTLLTGSFSVKVTSINAYISVSETFVFASVLLFGVEAGTVTVLLECLVIVFWMRPQGRAHYRVLFNTAAPSVAIWISGHAFYLVSGTPPYSKLTGELPGLPQLFLPLLTFTALYFLLNSWLVAIAVGLETERSPADIWWRNFAWLSVNYFSGASVAALIVTYTRHIEVSTLVIIVPLLVVSYLTFRTAMGRAEDSYTHIAELNRLHLSTIETLAMAIDAKDQITHGHIRRVQAYAVGLSRRIGVTDEKLVKAIEAAALLHDMGKLAVPEHILNKPGKLTAAEFEKMKLHASVGADILSAIDFPYPVVPIVRHHHENWDGSGYPAGLRGTDIPIGARILSVVDCFDALTSDRPYRPKLSDAQALEILNERRGKMYDPLIVDEFVRSYKEFAPPVAGANASQGNVFDINSSPLREAARRHAPALPLTSAFSTFDVPFSSAAVFLYDINSDSIEASFVAGAGAEGLDGIRIPRGERLSGWVAANRQTIMNSDPVLDLGGIVLTNRSMPRSCLSTPILRGEQLVGVLTLYAEAPDSYHDEHRVAAEAFAREIASSIPMPQSA